jgi:hypothetical protein
MKSNFIRIKVIGVVGKGGMFVLDMPVPAAALFYYLDNRRPQQVLIPKAEKAKAKPRVKTFKK